MKVNNDLAPDRRSLIQRRSLEGFAGLKAKLWGVSPHGGSLDTALQGFAGALNSSPEVWIEQLPVSRIH